MSMPDEWHVKYDETIRPGVWFVLRYDEGVLTLDPETVRTCSRQADAWQCAQIHARKWRGVAVLHSKKGMVREERIYNARLRREMGLRA